MIIFSILLYFGTRIISDGMAWLKYVCFVLLILWRQGNPAVQISLGPVNLYTVLFILFFGIGYGAYYATADMPIPMFAWIATLFAMKGYTLTGERMKEIQAVNAARKEAIAEGMTLAEAIEKIL